jgi:hypothetical protein
MAMKQSLKCPRGLRQHFDQEHEQAIHCYETGRLAEAWRHLERAHVLGQAYPLEHTLVHWRMFEFGFRIRNRREVMGQVLRLLAGGVKSFVGKLPAGNTGGANVPPLQPMEIPADLLQILRQFKPS